MSDEHNLQGLQNILGRVSNQRQRPWPANCTLGEHNLSRGLPSQLDFLGLEIARKLRKGLTLKEATGHMPPSCLGRPTSKPTSSPHRRPFFRSSQAVPCVVRVFWLIKSRKPRWLHRIIGPLPWSSLRFDGSCAAELRFAACHDYSWQILTAGRLGATLSFSATYGTATSSLRGAPLPRSDSLSDRKAWAKLVHECLASLDSTHSTTSPRICSRAAFV